MSYQYSNPYQPAPGASRSTFAAAVNVPTGYQVLFAGLPLDVVEKDLRELLLNPPLSLAATSTTVRTLHASDGTFTGGAIVTVNHADDAERLRREYSGQNIDGTYRLTVQHILPATQPLPAPSVVPFAPAAAVPTAAAAAPVPVRTPSGPRGAINKGPVGVPGRAIVPQRVPTPKAVIAKPAVANQAPGLALLSRMRTANNAASGKQLALLAKQKANIRGAGAGSALLSRLAGSSPVAKRVAKSQARKVSVQTQAGAGQKVARAKANNANNSGGMDIDPSPLAVAPGGKFKGGRGRAAPTAEELDAEMKAYERAKRFA